MPKPAKGESQKHYLARYMSSKEAEKSFPDQKQRAAVAYSEFSRRKKRKKDA
jgi:hypothetical protein